VVVGCGLPDANNDMDMVIMSPGHSWIHKDLGGGGNASNASKTDTFTIRGGSTSLCRRS